MDIEVAEGSEPEKKSPTDRWAAAAEAVKNLRDYDFDAWSDQRKCDAAQAFAFGDDIAAVPSDTPTGDRQKEELARRKAALEANPQSGRSWDEVKAHARQTRPGSGETEPSETSS